MKASKETVIRTAVLALALINQVLTIFGHSIIPITNEQVTELISVSWTVGASLWAWWKNNSFTLPAIQADKLLNELKIKKDV